MDRLPLFSNPTSHNRRSTWRTLYAVHVSALVFLVGMASLPLAQALPHKSPLMTPLLRIPAVDVERSITQFPLDGTSWAIDAWESEIGHLQGTAWTQFAGNIVLGGHAEYPNGRPGIFAGLVDLEMGDVIILIDEMGRKHVYRVTEIRSVAYDDLSVLLPMTANRLTLITCDTPTYDAARHQYARRVVVIAEPANYEKFSNFPNL